MSDQEFAFDISVVIPAYNSGLTLGNAIESVLSQTLPAREIIVIDDGSTDETAEVAHRYENVKYIRQENAGASAARNRGIEASQGQWIAFLDSDDIWKPHHMEGISGIIKRHKLVWACGGKEEITKDNHAVKVDASRWEGLLADGEVFENFFEACAKGAPFSASGIVIKHKVFDELGVFDTTLTVGEDPDIYCRIAHKFPKVGFLWPPSHVVYRSGDSLMARYGDKAVSFLNLLDRHWDIAASHGQAGAKRFSPLARRLALMAFRRGLRECDSNTLSSLVHKYGSLLGKRRYLVWMALVAPGMMKELQLIWLKLRSSGKKAAKD